MIIQCPACQTRFKLPGDKVKPGGIKVRCSKCKHIFPVTPPAPEPPPAEEVDFDALNMQPDDSPAEEPSPQEPSPPAPQDDAFSFGEPSQAQDQEPAPEQADDFDFGGSDEAPSDEPPGDDLDFSFGEESADDQQPAEISFEEPPASVEQESSDGLDFSFGQEEAPGEPAAEDAVADEFSFEADTDQNLAFETTTTEESGTAGGDEFSFGGEDSGGSMEFSFDTEADGTTDEPDAFSFGEESGGGADELQFETETAQGTDDEFDFNDASAEPDTGDAFDFNDASIEQQEPQTPPQPESQPVSAATAPEEAAVRTAKAPPRRRNPFARLVIFLLVLLVLLCGIAAYLFYMDADTLNRILGRQATTQSTQEAPQIRVMDLSSQFVNNQEAGQLFVIHGKAVNDYAETRSAISVKGVLFRKGGKPAIQQTVFCGNPLEESELRNLPFAKIEETMNNQFGDTLSNLNVASGKSLPFTIVFKNLPADLAEFVVEVGDSKPGAKP